MKSEKMMRTIPFAGKWLLFATLLFSLLSCTTIAAEEDGKSDPVKVIFEDMMFAPYPGNEGGMIRKLSSPRNLALIGDTTEKNKAAFWGILKEFSNFTNVQFEFPKEGKWNVIFVFSDDIIKAINNEYLWVWKSIVPMNFKKYLDEISGKIIKNKNKCFGHLNSSKSIVSGGIVFIENSAPYQIILKCINKYMFTMFGFIGETNRVSSIKNNDDEHYLLSEAEIRSLKILYDSELKPGLKKDDFFNHYKPSN
jgi:hypothetical protein